LSSFYLERIQRGVDFAEAHLDEEVALAAIARAGGLSQWHFQRIFKSMTQETLKGYLRARRMALALERLVETELRVIDIAVLAGFESAEAFARAFKHAFGISPIAYRKLGNRRMFVSKARLDGDMLVHVRGNVTLEPELVRQPAMTLVGCSTHFFGADSDKNNIGERLPPLWQSFLPRRLEVANARPDVCFGVLQQERDDGDRLAYLAGVEVSALGPLPPGMVAIEIPAAIYARFEHRGRAAAVDRTVSYAYATWLLNSGRRHTYGPDLEIYDGRYRPDDDASVLTYAIPVTE
jgi:AraC-like DNA-binding protein/predicted transcriptional regulator YdeE